MASSRGRSAPVQRSETSWKVFQSMTSTFGPYQLIRKLAQGGMAEVFLASRQGEIGGFSKQVAIKRIYEHLAEDPELITMFFDEGRIAARLNHSNIVQIYDLGQIDGCFYIAMEFVNGCDLRSLCERGLKASNFLPLPMAVKIAAASASGLHYAHTRVDEHGRAREGEPCASEQGVWHGAASLREERHGAGCV